MQIFKVVFDEGFFIEVFVPNCKCFLSYIRDITPIRLVICTRLVATIWIVVQFYKSGPIFLWKENGSDSKKWSGYKRTNCTGGYGFVYKCFALASYEIGLYNIWIKINYSGI